MDGATVSEPTCSYIYSSPGRRRLRSSFTLQLHVTPYRLSSEMLRFVLFVCNYPRGPHVVSATWPCTYLFRQKLKTQLKSVLRVTMLLRTPLLNFVMHHRSTSSSRGAL